MYLPMPILILSLLIYIFFIVFGFITGLKIGLKNNRKDISIHKKTFDDWVNIIYFSLMGICVLGMIICFICQLLGY